MTIKFTVYGLAQPAGSKRGFAYKKQNGSTGVAISDANPKSRDWKTLVAAAAQRYRPDVPLAGPVAVTMTFVRPRPAGHFNSRRELNKKGLESTRPIGRPDALKLARGVEDALTGIIWGDDSQIVEEHLFKRWGATPCVDITVVVLGRDEI